MLARGPRRVSQALDSYYTAVIPHEGDEESRVKYGSSKLDTAKRERVDLWVCVSGVASTIEDALLKEAIEKEEM